MNLDKVKELRERADKAGKLAEELEILQKTYRFAGTLRFESGGNSLFPRDVLSDLFDLGRQALIEKKERELVALLPDESPKSPTVVDNAIGTLDTSNLPIGDGCDTWEQPA